MALLIQDVAEFLASKGIGTFNASAGGGNIFLGLQPNEPNDCVTLYDAGGQGSNFGLPDSRRTVQVIVRGSTFAAAHAKAWAVYDEMITNLRDDGHFLKFNNRKQIISATSNPTNIGKDEKGRHELSLTFEIWTVGA